MNLDPLRRAFDSVAAACGTVAVAGVHGGELVLDVAAGHTRDGDAFQATTPVFLYSAVKPVAALCVLVAAADGALDIDTPIARSWPAFAAHGKHEITVAQALAHGAAVPGWREPMAIADLADRVTAEHRLAASTPWWTPGEPGEHAVSYGHLLDGILRHATGDDIAAWWTVATAACGVAIDLIAGTGARRPAPLVDPGGEWRATWGTATGPMADLLANPAALLDVAVVNSPDVRGLIAPAVTGYASARELAWFWSWWAGPDATARLGPNLHGRMLRAHLRGFDQVLARPVAWGLGPQFDDDGSYGMGGVGGCVGWYAPDLDLALGITTPIVGAMERLDPIDEAIDALRRG